MTTDTQVMQNAHDVLHLAAEHVFRPLYAIQQDHLSVLQGGGGRRGQAGDVHAYVNVRALRRKRRESESGNIRKVRALVKRIKGLYAKLKREVGKRFDSEAARQQSMQLIQDLSTQLFGVVEFFRRQLDKIRELPQAVTTSMQSLPATWADFHHRYVAGRGKRRNPLRAVRRRS